MASINKVIEGLQILAKYHDADNSCGVCAEHDIIYAGPYLGDENPLSDEDKKKMEELGWMIDTESYATYV